MNDLAKERDGLQQRNDELRQQLEDAQQAGQHARQSYLASQQEADSKLEAERVARDAAKAQLDRRIEEMRARKSKFAVRCVVRFAAHIDLSPQCF